MSALAEWLAAVDGGDSGRKYSAQERDIDKYHQARGFEILCFGRVYHVAYHYLIMPNGRVQTGRPERCEGVGDFSSEDNPAGKEGPINSSGQPTQSQANRSGRG